MLLDDYKKIHLHGKKIEIGDRVWHKTEGWGSVAKLKNETFLVKFDEKTIGVFFENGKEREDEEALLFWRD